jgi:hypothetical protein
VYITASLQIATAPLPRLHLFCCCWANARSVVLDSSTNHTHTMYIFDVRYFVCVVNCLSARLIPITLLPTPHSELDKNYLTGVVPPLPFKQYGFGCVLNAVAEPSPPAEPCTEPQCNHFKCPLPAGSEQCTYESGGAGVHCK